MQKEVSIKEGEIGRRIAPVDKVKINTTGDGESLWVPAERGNTGVLYASENGIYIASEDGYESYSEVVVRVTEESFYGDKDFDHWNYEVPTDFPDLWDPLTLDDFNIDPLAFDDVFNNKDKWDMDVPDLPDKIDFKMKDLKTKKPKKEKISGIDPVSGNEYSVGVDVNGFLSQDLMPSEIKITVLPNKLEYKGGEYISLGGIQVKAYTKDGNIWNNNNYPNGIIPTGELIQNPLIADAKVANAISGNGSCSFQVQYKNISKDQGVSVASGGAIATGYSVAPHKISDYAVTCGAVFVLASNVPFTVNTKRDNENVVSEAGRADIDGKTFYYTYKKMGVSIIVGDEEKEELLKEFSVTVSPSVSEISDVDSFDDESAKSTAASLINGTLNAEMGVTVEWIRPDGVSLYATYTITVTASPESDTGTDTQAINYNGTRYVANEDMNAEAHYQSGTVWIRGEAKVWSVPDAVAFGLLKPEEEKDGGSDSGSEHEGGHF